MALGPISSTTPPSLVLPLSAAAALRRAAGSGAIAAIAPAEGEASREVAAVGATPAVGPRSGPAYVLAGSLGGDAGAKDAGVAAGTEGRSATAAVAGAAPASAGRRPSGEATVSTAYQTNEDGDSAELSSRRADLTETEQRRVAELAARDREVRTHEQAHVAAAGNLFRGGPFYNYTKGPDGRNYATSGHVNIDTGPGATPEETIERAARVRRAALAPAEPSGADRAVAAQAARLEAEARAELAKRGGRSEPRSDSAVEGVTPAGDERASGTDATPSARPSMRSASDAASTAGAGLALSAGAAPRAGTAEALRGGASAERPGSRAAASYGASGTLRDTAVGARLNFVA